MRQLYAAIGIFIFLIVTAYDAKKIQAFYSYYGNVPEMATKSSIFAALQLYLDFINLFVYLLRFVEEDVDDSHWRRTVALAVQ